VAWGLVTSCPDTSTTPGPRCTTPQHMVQPRACRDSRGDPSSPVQSSQIQSSPVQSSQRVRRYSRDDPSTLPSKYSAWVKRADALHSGLRSQLGAAAASKLTLADSAMGSAMMRGKLTSLSMIGAGFQQQREVVSALKKHTCFSAANPVQLSMIATVATKHMHPRYGIVYREGASSQSFYLLVRGSIEFTMTNSYGVATRTTRRRRSQEEEEGDFTATANTTASREVISVHAGGAMVCFGVEGLTGGLPREATASCLDACEVLHFSTFRMRLSEEGASQYAARAFASFVQAELQHMPLFFGLSPDGLIEVSQMFELRECASAGTVLYNIGDPPDAMYVLAKGRVALEHADGTLLAKLQAGSSVDGYPFFGERAMLMNTKWRTTSATTRTPCKLLILPRAHFGRLSQLIPTLKSQLHEVEDLRTSRAELTRLEADRELRLRCEAKYGRGDDDEQQEDVDIEVAAQQLQRCWRGAHARGKAAPQPKNNKFK